MAAVCPVPLGGRGAGAGVVSLHGDLLRQAHQLALREPKRPRQASLRSISASYCGLFHLLIDEAVTLMVTGADRGGLRDSLARAFKHGTMKAVAETFRAVTSQRKSVPVWMAESPSGNSSASRKRLSIFSRPATKRTTTGRDGLHAKKRSIYRVRRDRLSRIGKPCEEPSKLTLSSLLCSPTTICGSKNEAPLGAQPCRPLYCTAMGRSWPPSDDVSLALAGTDQHT